MKRRNLIMMNLAQNAPLHYLLELNESELDLFVDGLKEILKQWREFLTNWDWHNGDSVWNCRVL